MVKNSIKRIDLFKITFVYFVEKEEKKPAAKPINPPTIVIEKETKKENSTSKEVSVPVVIKEKVSKDVKREEKQREKEEADLRKREKERRRERKANSPGYYDLSTNDRYYSTEQYDERERERDRDLSSISNSSNGSTNRRSHDSPDIDRGISMIKNGF